ncbi:hypothetical protein B0T09DRAFT_37819 [Sordaria sp. MPI-SDFR-AT-0083]|nr:hypothetical protein B0T09DRAFT_37819 [Sordaria sp. MPI-SDFR-AT-0083]
MSATTWYLLHSQDNKNGQHGDSVVTKWTRRVKPPNFAVVPLGRLVDPAPASLGVLALGGTCAGISRSPPAAHSPACASHIHLPPITKTAWGFFYLHHFHFAPAPASNGMEIGCADKHGQHHHINTDGHSFHLISSAKHAWAAWGMKLSISDAFGLSKDRTTSRMGAIRKIAIGLFSSYRIPRSWCWSCEWAALELARCDCAFNCITDSHELLLRVYSKQHFRVPLQEGTPTHPRLPQGLVFRFSAVKPSGGVLASHLPFPLVYPHRLSQTQLVAWAFSIMMPPTRIRDPVCLGFGAPLLCSLVTRAWSESRLVAGSACQDRDCCLARCHYCRVSCLQELCILFSAMGCPT